ncbi:hypothetical protein NC652_022411 [Populus alba x Populus x berolinensis]|nr:hypothetical protein NC652_022411 [Populus alba x Populus x berolinensis]
MHDYDSMRCLFPCTCSSPPHNQARRIGENLNHQMIDLQVVPKHNGCGSNGCGYQTKLVILGDCLLQHHCATKREYEFIGYGIWSGGVLGSKKYNMGAYLPRGLEQDKSYFKSSLLTQSMGRLKDLMYTWGSKGYMKQFFMLGTIRWILTSVTETWCAERTKEEYCFSI